MEVREVMRFEVRLNAILDDDFDFERYVEVVSKDVMLAAQIRDAVTKILDTRVATYGTKVEVVRRGVE